MTIQDLKNANAVMAGKMSAEKLGIEALDERILRIVLDKKTPYLPAMLTHSVLLPTYSSDLNQIIGNGAYQFTEQQGDTVILTRNPYYWGKANVYFEQVNYRKVTSGESENNLDLIENVQNITPETMFLPKLCTYFYEFNFNDPMLAKREVREALRAMISVRNIVPQDEQSISASVSFLPQSMDPEQQGDWKPALVENLLQTAGINDKSPLQLSLTFDQDSFHQQIAQRLIQAWSQSDMIRVHAEPVSWQTLLEKRAKGDFQIIRSGWCADYNDLSAFLMNFHSQSPENKTRYANPLVDQLLEKSTDVISAQQRQAIYQQIVQLLKNDHVVLPIFQYRTPISANPDLLGIDTNNPTGIIYSKDLRRAN
ncbi:MAG: peptide ABC transporter substrate-binding protein [[Pasteurella] aerogenes]|nr:peptide ABC transporter substrate-binding protein [[Pasteurella] aerogenes]